MAPNYVDPVTRGNASSIVNGIFIALVLIVVTLRFYCRTSAGALRLGWDDVMISLALLFTLGLTAVVILAEKLYGWDRHVWDIPTDRITNANIIALVAKIVFSLAATFTRLSLCAFYYRLVKDSGIRWFKTIVHVTNAFTIAVCVAFLFISIFQCTPVKFYWEFPPTTAGTCMNEGKATLAAGIINLFNDFLCAVIPIPLVMNLHMPLKQRVGVCVLFGLGFIVIVAGSVRTYFIWKGLMQSYDETWYAYPLWICAAVEIDVGVVSTPLSSAQLWRCGTDRKDLCLCTGAQVPPTLLPGIIPNITKRILWRTSLADTLRGALVHHQLSQKQQIQHHHQNSMELAIEVLSIARIGAVTQS
ncbi:hypothetical protein LTR86_008770 [Recurvomyces mirabilis]|nr:hypothetical protein LTR86_008770 [Recurvomyces mirabilis]